MRRGGVRGGKCYCTYKPEEVGRSLRARDGLRLQRHVDTQGMQFKFHLRIQKNEDRAFKLC